MSAKSISTGADLHGVFPALFTPLLRDDPKHLNNGIDYEKAKRLIDDLIQSGVSGLVPVGTTGQSATLSPQQHFDFIRFTMEYVDSRIPVIAGAGSNSTRESIEMINRIQKEFGSVAVLCVTGYYNNPPQEGLLQHFSMLSSETAAKIVIYNVPARTASYLEAETLIALANDVNIIGLKQAVDFKSPGTFREDTIRIIKETRELDFAVVTGEDDALHSILSLGGTGIITASGNIPEVSKLYQAMIAAHAKGDHNTSEKLQTEAMAFVQKVFCRKNPIPLGTFFNSPLFLPLVSVRQTAGGIELEREILDFIRLKAPSLEKYHT